MCTIFILEPGKMIDRNKLDCAIGNNLDGVGVVLKDPSVNRLQVIRKFRTEADGGPDNDELFDLLEDNKDIIRYVHLRNQTKGAVTEDNVHPFNVYHSDTRQIWAVHNGTVYEFSPKGDDQRCDSRIFVEEFLSPLLLNFTGEFGKGDYNHPIIKQILNKYISGANRLLIMSNDLDPLMIGNWSEIRNADGTTFKASNNDYFDTIKRGPRMQKSTFRAPWSPPTQATPPHVPNTALTVVSRTPTQPTKPSGKVIPNEEAKALITQAREARKERKITSLSELMNIPPVEDSMMEILEEHLEDRGYGEEYWKDWGFQLISWLKDEEILSLTLKLNEVELVKLIRDLCEVPTKYEEEIDVFDQQLAQANREIKRLQQELATANTFKEKHEKASRRIEQLVQGLPMENRIG